MPYLNDETEVFGFICIASLNYSQLKRETNYKKYKLLIMNSSHLFSRRRSPHGVVDLSDLEHGAALGRQLVVDAVHPGPHGIEVRPLFGYSDIALDLVGLLGLAVVAEYGYLGVLGQVLGGLVKEVVRQHQRLIVYDLHQPHKDHIGHTGFAGSGDGYGLLLLQCLSNFRRHLYHFNITLTQL